MISERHKSNDLVTILCLGCCYSLLLLLSAAPLVHSAAATAGGVFEVLAQSTASETEATTTATTKTTTAAAVTTVTATKTNASQDEVGQPQPQLQLQPVTPSATTAPRLDHNNNNEWRPLGHGDPLQKDPTYDYSPPALDRVRYWAENNGTGQSNPEARKKELPPEVLRNKTKSEILLLGVASERVRVPHSHSYPGMGLGQQQQYQQQHQQQQQQQLAKYAAIRRSYYAPPQQQQLHQQIQQHNQQFQQPYTQKHQQHAQSPQQIHSQSQQHSQNQQHSPIQQQLLQNQHQHQPQFQQQPQQQHMPPTHLMPPPMMMMKAGSGSVEYRHSMTGGSPGSISGSPSMSTSYMSHINHMSSPPPMQYMTSSMAYHPPYTSWHSSAPISGMSSMAPHRLNYADAHHQESMQHYSFSSRPHQTVSYSPNSLPGHLGASKASLRKPWLHELLQKEVVVKPKVKPTMPATKYLMGTSKPHQALPPAGYGISSTRPPMAYAPMTFVPGPPTIAVPTVASSLGQEIYITPTPQTSSSSGFRPMLMTSPTSSASYSIPMTTPTPLPIYLRPESSSSTTTTTTATTNNRLMIPQTSNLAQRPTVAPAPESTTDSLFSHYKQPPKALLGPMYLIIEGHSKVKTYGQNELDPHSPKIVPVISKREPVVRIADPNEKRGTVETFQVKHLHTKTTPMTTTTPKPSTTTTERPVTSSSTSKPTQRTTTLKTTTTTTKTTTTTSLPSSTTPFTTPPSTTTPSTPPPSGVNDLLSLLDNMFADVHEIASSTASVPLPVSSPSPASSTMSTILKPVSTRLLPQQPEPRIGTQAGSISSLLENDEAGEDLGSEFATSTEMPLRSTRQVFDYDQLPESRVRVGATATTDIEYNDDDDDEGEEDELEEANFDDEAAPSGSQQEENEEAENEDEMEEEDTEYNLLKRIDRFVDDVDDGEDDLEDLIEERRQQH